MKETKKHFEVIPRAQQVKRVDSLVDVSSVTRSISIKIKKDKDMKAK